MTTQLGQKKQAGFQGCTRTGACGSGVCDDEDAEAVWMPLLVRFTEHSTATKGNALLTPAFTGTVG